MNLFILNKNVEDFEISQHSSSSNTSSDTVIKSIEEEKEKRPEF